MSGKQRIAVVSQCFWPEPFRINDICAEWVKRGYEVTAITAIPNYPQGDFYPGYGWTRRRRDLHEGIRILHLPMIPRKQNKICLILNYISFLISGLIWARMTKRRFDRVFIFETSPMTQALIGTTLAKRLHIPCDLYVQDLWPDNVEVVAGVKNRRILNAISRMCDGIYRDSTRILATSPSFVETLASRGVQKEKLLYWPQYAEAFYRPMERERVRAAEADATAVRMIPDDNSLNIIFTGNIGAAQGLEILPQAAKLLKNRETSRPVRFVIVGDGRARESFEKELQRQQVSDHFVMIPRQPAEEIPRLLACCDAAFLSFMDTELFKKTIPAKLQSYMACGIPVIASAEGETERIIREADCGWSCPLGDAEALAETIASVCAMSSTDPKALAGYGERAVIYSKEHFDRDRLLGQLEELWQRTQY